MRRPSARPGWPGRPGRTPAVRTPARVRPLTRTIFLAGLLAPAPTVGTLEAKGLKTHACLATLEAPRGGITPAGEEIEERYRDLPGVYVGTRTREFGRFKYISEREPLAIVGSRTVETACTSLTVQEIAGSSVVYATYAWAPTPERLARGRNTSPGSVRVAGLLDSEGRLVIRTPSGGHAAFKCIGDGRLAAV